MYLLGVDKETLAKLVLGLSVDLSRLIFDDSVP
jgi:hypothetical protein